MRTPSLRSRVVVIGVVIVLAVMVLLDVLLYTDLHRTLYDNLDVVLADRARIVTFEAAQRPLPDLPDRLTQLGVVATIHLPDGSVRDARPSSPSLGNNLPGADAPRVSRRVPLKDGASADVYVRRSGVDMALSRLLRIEIGGTLLTVALAGLLLRYTSTLMLRPLRQMAASARRTAAGEKGQRLHPDQPATEIGMLATAYDEMVEGLETAAARAREAERRLDALHRRSRQVIETANDAFVAIDARGVILDWNRRAEEMLGWTATDAIGRRLEDRGLPLPPDIAPAGVAPAGVAPADDADVADDAVADPVERVEIAATRRSGERFPAEISWWQTTDGAGPVFNAFVTDITGRRLGEEAVQRLAAIVDSAQEAVISASLDSVIVTWNRGAEQLYGFTAEEAIGQPLGIIVPPSHEEEVPDFLGRITHGEAVPQLETVRRCKNGTLVDVAVTASPVFGPSGQVVAQSIIARDITEQRWIARTLDQTLESLRAALDESQRAEARVRLFLDDAAHQLRAPVAGIRATAEALLRIEKDADRDVLLAALVREVSRAGRLVSGLLTLARIDHDPTVTPAPCDVLGVCRAEVERLRATATVECELASTLRRKHYVVDAVVLGEILGNLLENGARHATSMIDVAAAAGRGVLTLTVRDDGPGVPTDETERIFERFVSLDGRGGSGLGLPIARSLARAHGGDLACCDGAFVLTLPTDGVEDRRDREDLRQPAEWRSRRLVSFRKS